MNRPSQFKLNNLSLVHFRRFVGSLALCFLIDCSICQQNANAHLLVTDLAHQVRRVFIADPATLSFCSTALVRAEAAMTTALSMSEEAIQISTDLILERFNRIPRHNSKILAISTETTSYEELNRVLETRLRTINGTRLVVLPGRIPQRYDTQDQEVFYYSVLLRTLDKEFPGLPLLSSQLGPKGQLTARVRQIISSAQAPIIFFVPDLDVFNDPLGAYHSMHAFAESLAKATEALSSTNATVPLSLIITSRAKPDQWLPAGVPTNSLFRTLTQNQVTITPRSSNAP